jgi:Bacterial Ig domain
VLDGAFLLNAMTPRMTKLFRAALSTLLVLAACSGSDVAPEDKNTPVNHRPVVQELPDTSISVGSQLQLTVNGSDPDGDSLSFHGVMSSSLTDLYNGTLPVYNFDSPQRTLHFNPQAYDRPGRTAILWAEDGRGGVDTMRVHVTVN